MAWQTPSPSPTPKLTPTPTPWHAAWQSPVPSPVPSPIHSAASTRTHAILRPAAQSATHRRPPPTSEGAESVRHRLMRTSDSPISVRTSDSPISMRTSDSPISVRLMRTSDSPISVASYDDPPTATGYSVPTIPTLWPTASTAAAGLRRPAPAAGIRFPGAGQSATPPPPQCPRPAHQLTYVELCRAAYEGRIQDHAIGGAGVGRGTHRSLARVRSAPALRGR